MNLDQLTDHMITTANDDYPTAVRLMVECLSALTVKLSEVGLVGVDIARKYWVDGSATKTELEQARVECWNYLEEHSASTNTEEPEHCALRAVISVLYADQPSEDLGELVNFFNEMLRGTLINKNENAFSEEIGLIVEEFSKQA